MSRRRLSFTEKRRVRVRMQVDRLKRLESKQTITERSSVPGLSTTAFRGLTLIGIMQSDGGGCALVAMKRSAKQAKRERSRRR
jgi:hypothetical protein